MSRSSRDNFNMSPGKSPKSLSRSFEQKLSVDSVPGDGLGHTQMWRCIFSFVILFCWVPWENHNTALHDDMMLIGTIRPGWDIKHRCLLMLMMIVIIVTMMMLMRRTTWKTENEHVQSFVNTFSGNPDGTLLEVQGMPVLCWSEEVNNCKHQHCLRMVPRRMRRKTINSTPSNS